MNQIAILYTGDVHARIEQLLRAAQVAQQVRDKLHEMSVHSLLIDAGDVDDRALLESDVSRGAALFRVLKAAGYDASAVGNGAAATYGPQCFAAIAQASDLPILCANVVDNTVNGDPAPGMQAALVQQVGFYKVGLVGVTASLGGVYERIFGFKTPHPLQTARKHMRDLRARGCQVVGLLSHMGYDDDLRLAKALSAEIDFLIGGHSHTTLHEPENVQGVPVCHAGEYGEYVGQLNLTLNKEGVVTRWDGELIPVPVDGPAHTEAEHMWTTIKIETQRQLKTPVGALSDDLDYAVDRASGVGQLLADALRVRMQADIALCVSGHMYAGLAAGDVTLGDVLAICRSPQNPAVANVTGADIVAALEFGADPAVWQSLINHHDGPIGILQVSGLTYHVDFDAPTGERVFDVCVLGKPIDSHSTYSVAATDYEFNHQRGYFPELDPRLVVINAPPIMRDVILDHLALFDPLVPGIEPRIYVAG